MRAVPSPTRLPLHYPPRDRAPCTCTRRPSQPHPSAPGHCPPRRALRRVLAHLAVHASSAQRQNPTHLFRQPPHLSELAAQRQDPMHLFRQPAIRPRRGDRTSVRQGERLLRPMVPIHQRGRHDPMHQSAPPCLCRVRGRMCDDGRGPNHTSALPRRTPPGRDFAPWCGNTPCTRRSCRPDLLPRLAGIAITRRVASQREAATRSAARQNPMHLNAPAVSARLLRIAGSLLRQQSMRSLCIAASLLWQRPVRHGAPA